MRELQAGCDAIGGCPTGEARLTPAFGIPVKGIIHAVGPIYRGGNQGEPVQLGSAWRSALAIADEQGFRSIAFPSISTGIYGYPLPEAASVVAGALAAYQAERKLGHASMRLIRIVVRDPETKSIYGRAIRAALGS
jgi:O-acetyl-ADP-ribose deacetylase (regulator of RNase III)